jgi:hypothetical protein
MSASPDHVDVVVADDGSVSPVSPAEVARLGAGPGEHLRLARADGHRSARGRRRVRGVLVGRVGEGELTTDQDFAEAKRERLDLRAARSGIAAAVPGCPSMRTTGEGER